MKKILLRAAWWLGLTMAAASLALVVLIWRRSIPVKVHAENPAKPTCEDKYFSVPVPPGLLNVRDNLSAFEAAWNAGFNKQYGGLSIVPAVANPYRSDLTPPPPCLFQSDDMRREARYVSEWWPKGCPEDRDWPVPAWDRPKYKAQDLTLGESAWRRTHYHDHGSAHYYRCEGGVGIIVIYRSFDLPSAEENLSRLRLKTP